MQEVPFDDTVLEDIEMEGLVVRTGSPRVGGTTSRTMMDRMMYLFDVGRVRIQAFLVILMMLVLVFSLYFNTSSSSSSNSSSDIHQPIPHDSPSDRTVPTSFPTASPSTTIIKKQPDTPLSKEEKIQAQKTQWGSWHFWDNVDPDIRPPLSSYIPLHPNGDVPYQKFPPKAWQGDAVYVNHFLDSAVELVQRAKDVIYTEYGYGPKKFLNRTQIIQRGKLFKLHPIPNMNSTTSIDALPQGWETSGGWTTERTFVSLSKRLLHCMMIQCTFTLVMAGDDVKSRGRGNHISQRYLMQFQQLMHPIFQRLGMKLKCRTMASMSMNSFYTNTRTFSIHSALGFPSIYGSDIDMLIWDGNDDDRGGDDAAELDLLYRQALMSSKAPILVGGSFSLLRLLYLHADADVMALGNASSIWKITENKKQAETLPWSMRYVKCKEEDDESRSLCDDPTNKYRTLCGPEEFMIPKDTLGFREHRLKARVVAMALLEALEDALATWSTSTIMGGHPLRDDYWHIGNYYENIQSKVKSLHDPSIGTCHQVKEYLPERVCTVPLKAQTECTPRLEPEKYNIRSIIQPGVDGYIPSLTESTVNTVPDIPKAWLETPDDAIDVVQILSNRRQLMKSTSELSSGLVPRRRYLQDDSGNATSQWHVIGSLQVDCDGYMDNIGGIAGDESSGELVLTLDTISEGIVIMVFGDVNTTLPSSNDDEFFIDVSIDGTMKTISRREYEDAKKNFGFLTILDRMKGTASTNLLSRVQIRNCKSKPCNIMLTHIYWSYLYISIKHKPRLLQVGYGRASVQYIRFFLFVDHGPSVNNERVMPKLSFPHFRKLKTS